MTRVRMKMTMKVERKKKKKMIGKKAAMADY